MWQGSSPAGGTQAACLAALLSVYLAFLAQGMPKAHSEGLPSKGNDAQHLCLAFLVTMRMSATHDRLLVCDVPLPSAIPNAAALSVQRHVTER